MKRSPIPPGALFALALAAALPAAAESTQGRNLAASCAACHGTQGRSVAETPVLAGAPREELVKHLKEFRSGAREATVMHRHAKGYDDRQIELLADYFSSQGRQP